MAPPTSKRGGRFATTYDYAADRIGIRKPYLPAENRIVKALVEAALEGGLSHADAVRLAIGVYKEIDVLARDENGDILSRTAIKDIRVYCRGILRSGSTFSSFEIATRAVAAWRLTLEELAKLHAEWDRETVTQRLKLREIRKQAAAKGRAPKTIDPDQDARLGIVTPVIPTSRDEFKPREFEAMAQEGDPCTCSRETKMRERDYDDPSEHDSDCEWRMLLEEVS